MSTLKDELRDREYRRAYAESFANSIIATQLRLMRGSMTQREFADAVGMKQSRISAMEDENYAAWSTTTLKAIAARRDLVFVGRFLSFGQLLNWSANLSPESLTVPSFGDDFVFSDAPQPEATIHVDHVWPLSLIEGTTTEVPMATASARVVSTKIRQSELPYIGLVAPQRNAA